MIKQEMLCMRKNTHAVLTMLSSDPEKALCGLEIYNRTGLLPGTTYPILVSLQAAGWVRSYWAEAGLADPQQPRRRYYQITNVGVRTVQMPVAAMDGVAGLIQRWWSRLHVQNNPSTA
jgi:DNA-binding PadR family transcriptional regulator